MPRKMFGLTQKDKNAVKSGIVRAKNNPLGGIGSKTERRPQSQNLNDYNGICKVINIGFNTINIIDGFSDNYNTETSAGNLQINKFNLNLDANNFVITADVLIYIESSLDGDPATSANAEIKSTTATTLVYEAGKEKTLISRVKFASGIISKFSQENVNPRIFVTNEC